MPFYEIEGRGEKSGRKRKPKQYFAKDEPSALRQAKQDGLGVEQVTLLDVWGCTTTVAGCSHRNADNTSRQKILGQCRVAESIILEHEIGNRHDKHAIKVLRSNGEQLGYLPQEIAHRIIEGYWTPSGCEYWALNLGIQPMEDGSKLHTARISVLVSIASAENSRNGIARELQRLGCTNVTPDSVALQPLRGVAKESSSKASGDKSKSGCLGMVILFVGCLAALGLLGALG